MLQEIRNRRDLATPIEQLARLAGIAGQPARAARLYGAAEALREAVGEHLPPVERSSYDRDVAQLRHQLDPTVMLAMWDEGRALPLDDALAEAAAVAAEVAAAAGSEQRAETVPPRPSPAKHDLSPREFDVLRLLVAERTDREIAAILSVSRKTASHHVSAILRKLGVETRAGAVRRAVAERLIDAGLDRG